MDNEKLFPQSSDQGNGNTSNGTETLNLSADNPPPKGNMDEAAGETKQDNQGSSRSIPLGKVFPESLNVYDDEAKVAFEYFRKAAEKIIAEEDRINARREEIQKTIEEAKLLQNKGHKFMLYGWPLIIPFIVGWFWKRKGLKAQLAGEEELHKEDAAFNEIKRDYTISKLGVAYVPIATEVPFDGKSFMLDDTSQTNKQEFKLSQIKEYEEFMNMVKNLRELKETTPVSESGETPESIPASRLVPSFEDVTLNDHLGQLDRNLRSTTYYLNNVIQDSVSLPIIPPNGDYAKFLDEYCVQETGDAPVLNIFDNEVYSDDLKHFDEINEMQKKLSTGKIQLDSFLEEFMVEIGEYIQLIGKIKIASISKLLASGGETLLNTFNASYNHYSMDLAKEEIERLKQETFEFTESASIKPFILSAGSKMRYDAVSENWMADDGSRSVTPLGIHQIQEEIISPLVQNLLRETRIERLKIYNDIINQKLNYIKEWQKEVDDFYGRGRAEGNEIITQLQVTLGEFTTAYNQFIAFTKAENSFLEGSENPDLKQDSNLQQVLLFKEQADKIEEKKQEFKEYIERLQEEIERRANEFKFTCDYEAKLRDGIAKAEVMAASNTDQLDDRRKNLLAANPYIAANAKLPPEPTVNDLLYEKLATDLNKVASVMQEKLDELLKTAEDNPEDKKDSDVAPDKSDDEEKTDTAEDNPEDKKDSDVAPDKSDDEEKSDDAKDVSEDGDENTAADQSEEESDNEDMSEDGDEDTAADQSEEESDSEDMFEDGDEDTAADQSEEESDNEDMFEDGDEDTNDDLDDDDLDELLNNKEN